MQNKEYVLNTNWTMLLREAPSGKPTITEAGNSSATSIFLRWQPPHKVKQSNQTDNLFYEELHLNDNTYSSGLKDNRQKHYEIKVNWQKFNR